MNLIYKEDWEETKERFKAWWAHEYFGRCGLAVTALKNDAPDVSPSPDAETVEQRWYDLDWISRRMDYSLTRTYYGGEAVPVWNAGYCGVSAIPTFLGCPINLDMSTGWWDPILTAPDTIDFQSLCLDESHPDYRFTMRMLERAVEESRGRAIPSTGAFGGSGDTLAGLRGTEQLLIDCIERPQEVRAAEEFLMDMWYDFYDCSHEVIHDAAEGSIGWFTLWSPGKFYAAQNDFSYNISPEMFCDIFLPVIKQQTEFLDHTVYHVDGVNAFVHVDALCELPELQALQILPGAGKPSPLYYIDVLKKVQAAGKNLHISIAPEEVETALSELSARGLFVDTRTETEEEARQLLKNAEKWSKDRG